MSEKLALERYEAFDTARRGAERLAVDADDTATLKQIERTLDATRRVNTK